MFTCETLGLGIHVNVTLQTNLNTHEDQAPTNSTDPNCIQHLQEQVLFTKAQTYVAHTAVPDTKGPLFSVHVTMP